MKKLTILAIFAAISGMVAAQTANQPGWKELKEGHYTAAEKKVMKAYREDTTDVMSCWMVGVVCGEAKNPRRNNERAYAALLRTRNLLKGLNNLKRGLLRRDGLTEEKVEQKLREVTALGLSDAQRANTKEAFNRFRERYAETMTRELELAAQEGVSAIDYRIAEEENSVEGYEHFLAAHPESSQAAEAEQRMQKLAYDKAKSLNTLAAYERYVADYPDAEEAEEAEQQVYGMMYYRALAQNTEEAFTRYAEDYPESPFTPAARRKAHAMNFSKETDPKDWKSFKRYIEAHPDDEMSNGEARRIIAEISIETKNAEGLEWSLYKGDTMLRDTVIRALHDLYVNSDRIADFNAQYGQIAPADLKRKDKEALDAILDVQTNDRKSVKEAIRAIAPYRIAYDLLLYAIELDTRRGKWDYVRKTIDEYADLFDGNADYAALRATVTARETKANRKFLDDNVNSRVGEEYTPVVSADEQTIYFAGKNRAGNIGGEDIFMSTKNASGQWRRAYLVPGLNTVGHNESPACISYDGQTIIIFQNGKLMISQKDELGWSMPKALPKQLQIGNWQSDAMLTADGRAMLFVARTKTEHEVASSMNIYVTTLDDNGNWSEPVALGSTINSFGDDRAPFLHSDMKTLYFSSNRHSNIGGMDIFKSTRLTEDSWTEWSEPVNLGKEINTVGDDCWLTVNIDGTKAYMATKNGETHDICTIDLPESMKPYTVATLTGRVADKDDNPLGVEIRWNDLQTGKPCGRYTCNPSDGSFLITLPLGKQYEYYIASEGYYPTSGTIDLRTTTLAKKEHAVLTTATSQQMSDGDGKLELPLNGIFFNNSKATLNPLSKSAVNRLAKVINEQKRTVTITAYSEQQDTTDKTNMDLQRAQAVKEALVKACCNADVIAISLQQYPQGKSLTARQHKHRSLMTVTF